MHARKPDGGLDPIEFGIPQEPEFFMGGGGLYGTGRDYIAFLQMLMHGGEFNGARVPAPGNGGGDVEEQHGRRQDRGC